MNTEATILIVDDEKNTRDGLRRSLEDEFDVYVAANIAEAMEVLKNDKVDVMVTDLRLGGENGMDLIEAALAMPDAPITIMMTAYGSVDTAVEAMKRGAYHFVTKPLNIDELEIVIRRALRSRTLETENVSLKKQVEKKFSVSNILGTSAAMQPVFETIEQVAPTKATVLIEGESGTGKELVAHALHNLSGRPKSKLVIVHCAALSSQILESELFGHERGAFTGASERRIGRFEQADGGTLVLDEIGEIDATVQVKLLRALGERTIERVGGNSTIKVDVRVIAATNKNLKELVDKGEFREDLYYRMNVVSIHMPPMRERPEDVPILVSAFLKEFAKENGKEVKELTSEAMRALVDYPWPGNVRELRTAIEHGVVMCNGPKITLRHLPAAIRDLPGDNRSNGSSIGLSRPGELNLEEMEKRLIGMALEQTEDSRTEAAKLLGISRRTLQRKLKAFHEPKNE
jgi:two-component system response regulator AtoC